MGYSGSSLKSAKPKSAGFKAAPAEIALQRAAARQKRKNYMTSTQFVDLDNARLDEQRQVMKDIMTAGHCPFCPENLAVYNKTPILKQGKYWLIVPNQWPYEHTKVHLLLILRTHVTDLSQLDPTAGQELIELTQWAQREFKILGGALAVRFGDTNFSAGTINHLHAHLIQPDIYHPDYKTKPVRLKIGKIL
ncbi:MAG TPA: hypothetical protein DEP87_03670 [Candidatus Pacebacteria bacterium]|nr:hypothetical protein [Candidatus Paceibacterota bacterium]